MRIYILFITFITSFCAWSSELAEIGAVLQSTPCFSSHARCEIIIPNSDIPVIYDLRLMSSAEPDDTLSLCDYLIDWTLTTPAGTTSTGFAAYSDGNHFRYREGRLQEYHLSDDPTPFLPGGKVEKGVQSRAQFADYLPQNLGSRFIRMASDSSYIYNVARYSGRIVVSGVERIRGYDCREFKYTLDASTLLPLEIDFESNPGQPSEQTVTMTYSSPAASGCFSISEQSLAERYPDAFGKYRQDNYSLENLPGRPMPTFSAPTPTGERFTYNQGDPLPGPTVIAILDTGVDGTDAVVSQLRSALAESPVSARLILAFVDANIDDIEAVAGTPGVDEAILMSARTLARDCGVADTPAFIFCSPDGRVHDILLGRNNNLAADVIQKISLTQ